MEAEPGMSVFLAAVHFLEDSQTREALIAEDQDV